MRRSFCLNDQLKVGSHDAAATVVFFAATIGLHCNKWSHSAAALPHRMGSERILCSSGSSIMQK